MVKFEYLILYLFDRPNEPVYAPKGNKEMIFDVPPEYLPDTYRFDAVGGINRVTAGTQNTRIPLKGISLPDTSIPVQLGSGDSFSPFIPRHRKMTGTLIDIFMGMRTYEDLLSTAAYCRDRVDPHMFNYALSVAIVHRPDTKSLTIPALYATFPGKFFDSRTLFHARKEANLVPSNSRRTIHMTLDYTASDVEVEHHVAYWREDFGINLRYRHWHVMYPYVGPKEIVDKDRRGELFYYMHHQMLARYNVERLSNRMGRVKLFLNWREPVPEGYFPKLASLESGASLPPRQDGAILRDIDRKGFKLKIQDLERWRDRIYEAIHSGFVVKANGEKLELTERDGIDILGNILESGEVLSPNPNYYGDLYTCGHVCIAGCHDPDHRHFEPLGVMADTATAMRDPIFYRFHAFVDDIFLEHKKTLPAYTVEKLEFPGVQVTSIDVVTPNLPTNTLVTFWQRSTVDVSWGLDYARRGPVPLGFTHLNHSEFSYHITAMNNNNTTRKGTVRIFMAPRSDEHGKSFTFHDQKNLMIEMDKFKVTLNPGVNRIQRKSTESSLTVPFEQTFPKVEDDGELKEQKNFNGFDWPQHMLVPKGTSQCYTMVLFVMVSNAAIDRVVPDQSSGYSNAAIFWGIRDKKGQDARSMGFPFDRRPRDGVDTLAEFLTGNMATTLINIGFDGRHPRKVQTARVKNVKEAEI